MASWQSGYELADRYTMVEGRVFLSGIQALARLPIAQLRRDRAKGHNTAAFVSGYPGSPVGGFDQEVARAIARIPDLPITLRPAVNEEHAATAVMGSQLASEQPDARYDGVVGIWYAKGPGLDRAGDALRHAVFAGTARLGGAVAIVGDDPAAKSSTLPSSSDATMVDLHMPILYPGDVQEAVDLGLHAVALSRASGLWSGLKVVAPVADGTGTVDLDPGRIEPVIPETIVDGKPWVCHPNGRLLTPYTLELEQEFREIRAPLVRRYAVANGLNRVTVDPADPWIGLIASGYTYHELLEALRRLGLRSVTEIERAGIRLLQMRMPVPFEPETVRRFARGLAEIVVIEEKNPTLELLVKDALYAAADRPTVVGKNHEDGSPLIPSVGILDADAMVSALRARLSPRLDHRLTPPSPPARERPLIPLGVNRTPYFCSGCPHNRSTKVPAGALVGAGIGCHGMTLLMDEDRVGAVSGITAMGNEGTQWIGLSPFVERDHFIQNLGDGTFFHSGQLAIQAAVAAGVNITYKLLYNGTVAMTGGQDAPGGVGTADIATILLAHGVARVLVTTDDVGRYHRVDLPHGVDVWGRSRIVEAQEVLAAVPGVTVLIHDQACAAQSRRLRKRGRMETPPQRVVINHRICEGCGDCGEVSNCLSVQPLPTPLGTKTTIDQSSCNLDFSCLEGDGPAFMTVIPAERGSTDGATESPSDTIPTAEPIVPRDRLAIRFTGIGGTGVVTVSQVLGTAAMLDGWDVRGLDQTGLSQKAGPVVSDLRLSRHGPTASNLLGVGQADVVIAFDLLAAAADHALAVYSHDRTVVVGSTSRVPTGSMIGRPELAYPDDATLRDRLAPFTRSEESRWVDAGTIVRGPLGDGAAANVFFLLGVAVQLGCVPVDPDAIEKAITLNGVAVEANQAAFRWGRTWVLDPGRVEAAAGVTASSRSATVDLDVPELDRTLESRIAALALLPHLVDPIRTLAADLVAYQNTAYAGGFLTTVGHVAAAEAEVSDRQNLTEAVARSLHKLLAYKDEYEVARLARSSGAKGRQQPAGPVGGRAGRIRWHLHPPLLASLGLDRKVGLDSRVGRPAMWALARSKRLRGTAADPFGRTAMRRLERGLPAEYREAVATLVRGLTTDNLEEAIAIAALPQDVRGYEDLKMARAAEYRAELTARLTAYTRSRP